MSQEEADYANEEYGRLVKEFGFSGDDLDEDLRRQWEPLCHADSPVKFIRGTRKLFEQQKRANQGNPPSAARVAGTTASTGGPGSNLDALTEELAKLQQAPMRPGNWERMQEIEKEMEQVLPRR